MALSVLNNIASLAAQNQLTITNSNLQKSLYQLSSGSRPQRQLFRQRQ